MHACSQPASQPAIHTSIHTYIHTYRRTDDTDAQIHTDWSFKITYMSLLINEQIHAHMFRKTPTAMATVEAPAGRAAVTGTAQRRLLTAKKVHGDQKSRGDLAVATLWCHLSMAGKSPRKGGFRVKITERNGPFSSTPCVMTGG